jgi:hypothetical protein
MRIVTADMRTNRLQLQAFCKHRASAAMSRRGDVSGRYGSGHPTSASSHTSYYSAFVADRD